MYQFLHAKKKPEKWENNSSQLSIFWCRSDSHVKFRFWGRFLFQDRWIVKIGETPPEATNHR
jgi:hypothetical protein